MRSILSLLFLVFSILATFYYVNSNLEKTIHVTDLIKLNQTNNELVYSAQNTDDLNEIVDLKIFKNSEVIYISGDRIVDAEDEFNRLNLTIDRPGKNVILLLNSHEKITWDISSTRNTNIELVVYDGIENTVESKEEIFAFKTKFDLVNTTEKMAFIRVLDFVNNLTGIKKISYFYNKKNLLPYITVNSTQLDEKLSLDYLKGKKLDVNLDFDLISQDNKIIKFDLYGPKEKNTNTIKVSQNSVLSPDKQKLYKIMKNGLEIIDRKTNKIIEKPLPVIKKIHSPKGLAYDSLSDMIYLANKTGKFYVFDAQIEQWVAIRKYIEDYDINSFSYDEFSNVYVAATWKKEGLLFFDQKGNFATKHSLEGKLLGLDYHYHKKQEVPKLHVIPKGEDIIILYIKDFVQKIWYYDKLNRKAYLTYNYFNS